MRLARSSAVSRIGAYLRQSRNTGFIAQDHYRRCRKKTNSNRLSFNDSPCQAGRRFPKRVPVLSSRKPILIDRNKDDNKQKRFCCTNNRTYALWPR